MQDAETPTYLEIYQTPYDRLKQLEVAQLEELSRKLNEETRLVLLAQRWLEGILRHKRAALEATV